MKQHEAIKEDVGTVIKVYCSIITHVAAKYIKLCLFEPHTQHQSNWLSTCRFDLYLAR